MIFVATPITALLDSRNIFDGINRARLSHVLKTLRAATGRRVHCAIERERWGEDIMSPQICTPLDLEMIRKCLIVVAFPDASYGVHVELGWAGALGKPIILLVNDKIGFKSPLVEGIRTVVPSHVLRFQSKIPIPSPKQWDGDLLPRVEAILSSLERPLANSKTSVCEVIHKFMSERTTREISQQPRLEHALIKLNNVCNASCSFCDTWKNPSPAHLSLPWERIMSDLVSLAPKEVNFHGGEVFLTRGFHSILKMGRGKLAYSVTTNGHFLTDQQICKLYEHNVRRLYVSIDHPDPEINAQSRGIPGLGNQLFPAIKKLKTRYPDIELIINHVISKRNFDSFSEMVRVARGISADAINLIPIKDYAPLFLSVEQIQSFTSTVKFLLASGELDASFLVGGTWNIFGEEADWPDATKGRYKVTAKRACLVPSAVLFLDAVSGNVYPCDTTMYREDPSQYVLGNVLKDSLRMIWTGHRFKKFRSRMYPQITCSCAGGCDPNNFVKTGDSGDAT